MEFTRLFSGRMQFDHWNQINLYCYVINSKIFQIRFQEIGGALETACNKPISKDLISSSTEANLQLKPFIIGSSCISKCWTDGIYLNQLFLKFFKFCLQMFARLAVWMDECIAVKDWPNNELNRIDFFVTLYLDATALIKKIPSITNVIIEKLPVDLNTEIPLLEKALSYSRDAILNKLKKIEELWIKEMLSQTSGWTKQVADIPRLYRKTNRDAPSKACQYIEQILRPGQSFATKYSKRIPQDTVRSCLVHVFSQLNKQ